MLLWYTCVSVLLVANVFRSTGVDYRIIAVGAMLPLLLDIPFGHRAYAHTLVFAVATLVVVMLIGIGKPRLTQRRLLCLPIGIFAGLVLSGAWAGGDSFWWPFLGNEIGNEPLLPVWWVVLLEELAGLVALWWLFGQFDLYLPGPREEFKRTGRLRGDGRSHMIELVRHGRTEANASGLLLGRADPPLDERGRAQAAELAAVLARDSRPVDALVSSPLLRARETAEMIATVIGVPVEIEERLVEIDYGEWDGHPFADVPSDVTNAWRTDPAFAAPGGESLAAVGARVERCLDDLLARVQGGRIIAVSHVSPIKAAVVRALGLTDDRLAWRLRLDVASITRIINGPAGPVLLTFNETAHLS